MTRFGELLRTYRLRSYKGDRNKPLSQEQFADLLAQTVGLESLSGATISNWERGRYQIHKDDRAILVGLVKVLYRYGGLSSLSTANLFLKSGNYRSLEGDEIWQINPKWVNESSFSPPLNLQLTPEMQEALLPPPPYSRLFGVTHLINTLSKNLTSSTYPWVVSIVGLGGTGKTAIANAVARRLIHEKHFDKVVWITGELQMMGEFVDTEFDYWTLVIGEKIISNGLERQAPERRLLQVRNILKSSAHLIVLDNISREQQTTILFDQLNYLAQPSKFLLTSRYHPLPDANVFVAPTEGLPAEEALGLLKYRARETGVDFSPFSDGELEQICDLVGGHPLTLRLIPRLILMHSLPKINLQAGLAGHLGNIYQTVFERLWQTLSPEEKAFMLMMSLVGPTGAHPRQLMEISKLDEVHFWEMITLLIEQCLIELRGTIQSRRYGIHNLTEQYLNSFQTTGDPTIQEEKGRKVLANLVYWKQYLDQTTESSWEQLDIEYPNILSGIAASLQLPEEKYKPQLGDAWLSLSRKLFSFVERRGYWFEWIPLLSSLTEKFEGEMKCELLIQLGNLYRYNRQLPQAITVHEQAEQLARFLKNEEQLAFACAGLGLDYLHKREYETAESYGQEALELFERLQLTGRELGGTLNLLGLIARAKGNFDEAEKNLLRGLQIWRLLEQPVEQGRAYNNLALTFLDQKKYKAALTCFADARSVLEKTASKLDKVMVALSEGSLFFELGRWAEAEKVFKGISLSFLRESGHVFYEALTLNNLGNIRLVVEDYEEAEMLLTESVSLWEQIGEEVRLANTLLALGKTRFELGRTKEAKEIYERTSSILDRYPDDFRAGQLRDELARNQTELVQWAGKQKEADH